MTGLSSSICQRTHYIYFFSFAGYNYTWFVIINIIKNFRMLGDSAVSSPLRGWFGKAIRESEFHTLNAICLPLISSTAVYKEKKR